MKYTLNVSCIPPQLDQTHLGMPSRDYFLKDKKDQLAAYQEYATNVALLLGANENTARQEMADMVEFETKVANVSRGSVAVETSV